MADFSLLQPVLNEYPADCQPTQIEFLASAGGFSGARFWRLTTPRGNLALRQWPTEHPTRERLEFIQAVLWHVHQEGFDRVPLPTETRSAAGYVRHNGHFWELAPWLAGTADYHRHPSRARLQAALASLASFHVAAESFPLPDPSGVFSPGILERLDRVGFLLAGGLRTLSVAIQRHGRDQALEVPSAIMAQAQQWLALFPQVVPRVLPLLEEAAAQRVTLQPCIRDVWHDHVLFVGEQVSGLIDFGALRADHVAGDIARLLGSLAGDDAIAWQQGLAAYATVRPLMPTDDLLINAFDQSSVLLSAGSWLEWIFQEGRRFSDLSAVAARLEQNLERLRRLAGGSFSL